MQFNNDEWLSFANKLEQATGLGKLRWSGTDAASDPFEDKPGYFATIPNNATYRLRSRDNDGEFPFVVTIFDPSGVEVAEFTTIPFGDIWEQNENSDQAASAIIARLYATVARLVTGAPEKARALLNGLDAIIGDDNIQF